jgi:predicted small lipoprotein YifL
MVHACLAFSADARPVRVGPFRDGWGIGGLEVGLRDAVNVRLGVALALAAGLALAGCGRKGALEAPPSAALPQGPVAANPADPPPDPSLAAVLPEAAPAPPPSPSLAAPPRQGSTPLDWLLN